MGYSNDLRVRVIQVVEGGATARAAARQFVIGDFDGDPVGEAMAGDRECRSVVARWLPSTRRLGFEPDIAVTRCSCSTAPPASTSKR